MIRKETSISLFIRRRFNFDNLDNIVDIAKDKNFNKNLDTRNFLIKNTIASVLYAIMPEEDGIIGDYETYYEVLDEVKLYLIDRYYDELYKYFERRKQGYKD
jgi:hypothetical protein